MDIEGLAVQTLTRPLRHSQKRAAKRCVEVGCPEPRYCHGRCFKHWRELPPEELARLQSMTRAQREAEFNQALAKPKFPKWEWEGDETALAEMTERLKRGKHKPVAVKS